MSETTYVRNRETILNRAKEYYKNGKVRLWERERERTREQKVSRENYLKKKKMKKREHGRNRYSNMPNKNKQKLREYQKNIMKPIKKMHDYIRNKLLLLPIFFLIFLCTVLAQ